MSYEGWYVGKPIATKELFKRGTRKGIDVEASKRRFIEVLRELVSGEFPGAEVNIVDDRDGRGMDPGWYVLAFSSEDDTYSDHLEGLLARTQAGLIKRGAWIARKQPS